ncbi:hypothetical protein ABT034_32080 [Streptomyces sp. NPDC002773]|uniref:hypothetical protein n=1 Tax=Streptomyces sp. NPDC002773 TaxID=3154430 RepID=UPI0033268C4A
MLLSLRTRSTHILAVLGLLGGVPVLPGPRVSVVLALRRSGLRLRWGGTGAEGAVTVAVVELHSVSKALAG